MLPEIIIKHASEEDEFIQIHQINYMTFVEEIPQHEQNANKFLIDKFHHKNYYLIAKENDKVLGMVTYNFERPFSLDEKIADLNSYLPEFINLAEIRLLSLLPEVRNTNIAYRLLKQLAVTLMSKNTDAAVISGTIRQLELYKKIGFKPFANLIGKEGALYQPMYINLKTLRNDFKNN